MEASTPTPVTRVVAVLGYSARRHDALHPICAARLGKAEAIAEAGDVVVLSGWARTGKADAEAELMARAWGRAEIPLVRDADARHTVDNAACVVSDARELGAGELVVVTSWWHRPRTAVLVRRAARRAGIRSRTVAAPSPWKTGVLVRELGCLAALPLQLAALRRSRDSVARRPA
jgi:uncharacterized SAM-binding protein YcdF (DUF218 family)